MAPPNGKNSTHGTPLKSAMKSPKQVHFDGAATGEAGTTAVAPEKQEPTVTSTAGLIPQAGPAPSAPGLFVHTSENPSAALGFTFGTSTLNSTFPNQSFHHHKNNYSTVGSPNHTQPWSPLNSAFRANTPNVAPPITYIGTANPYTKPLFNRVATMSDGYQNATPPVQGAVHFQPPVPDTSHGPIMHQYVPRSDNNQFYMIPGQAVVPSQGVIVENGYIVTHYYAPVPQQVMVQQPAVVHGGAPVVAQPAFVQGGVGVVTTQPPIVMPAGPPPPPTTAPAYVNGQFIPVAPTPGAHIQGGQYLVGPGGIAVMGPGGIPAPVPMPGTVGLPPDVAGVGRTVAEVQAQQAQYAAQHNMNEPEDFQPRSTSPSRMYWCRELDGNWTQRSRCTIDEMGDREWRWYLTDDGQFYAVRLHS